MSKTGRRSRGGGRSSSAAFDTESVSSGTSAQTDLSSTAAKKSVSALTSATDFFRNPIKIGDIDYVPGAERAQSFADFRGLDDRIVHLSAEIKGEQESFDADFRRQFFTGFLPKDGGRDSYRKKIDRFFQTDHAGDLPNRKKELVTKREELKRLQQQRVLVDQHSQWLDAISAEQIVSLTGRFAATKNKFQEIKLQRIDKTFSEKYIEFKQIVADELAQGKDIEDILDYFLSENQVVGSNAKYSKATVRYNFVAQAEFLKRILDQVNEALAPMCDNAAREKVARLQRELQALKVTGRKKSKREELQAAQQRLHEAQQQLEVVPPAIREAYSKAAGNVIKLVISKSGKLSGIQNEVQRELEEFVDLTQGVAIIAASQKADVLAGKISIATRSPALKQWQSKVVPGIRYPKKVGDPKSLSREQQEHLEHIDDVLYGYAGKSKYEIRSAVGAGKSTLADIVSLQYQGNAINILEHNLDLNSSPQTINYLRKIIEGNQRISTQGRVPYINIDESFFISQYFINNFFDSQKYGDYDPANQDHFVILEAARVQFLRDLRDKGVKVFTWGASEVPLKVEIEILRKEAKVRQFQRSIEVSKTVLDPSPPEGPSPAQLSELEPLQKDFKEIFDNVRRFIGTELRGEAQERVGKMSTFIDDFADRYSRLGILPPSADADDQFVVIAQSIAMIQNLLKSGPDSSHRKLKDEEGVLRGLFDQLDKNFFSKTFRARRGIVRTTGKTVAAPAQDGEASKKLFESKNIQAISKLEAEIASRKEYLKNLKAVRDGALGVVDTAMRQGTVSIVEDGASQVARVIDFLKEKVSVTGNLQFNTSHLLLGDGADPSEFASQVFAAKDDLDLLIFPQKLAEDGLTIHVIPKDGVMRSYNVPSQANTLKEKLNELAESGKHKNVLSICDRSNIVGGDYQAYSKNIVAQRNDFTAFLAEGSIHRLTKNVVQQMTGRARGGAKEVSFLSSPHFHNLVEHIEEQTAIDDGLRVCAYMEAKLKTHSDGKAYVPQDPLPAPFDVTLGVRSEAGAVADDFYKHLWHPVKNSYAYYKSRDEQEYNIVRDGVDIGRRLERAVTNYRVQIDNSRSVDAIRAPIVNIEPSDRENRLLRTDNQRRTVDVSAFNSPAPRGQVDRRGMFLGRGTDTPRFNLDESSRPTTPGRGRKLPTTPNRPMSPSAQNAAAEILELDDESRRKLEEVKAFPYLLQSHAEGKGFEGFTGDQQGQVNSYFGTLELYSDQSYQIENFVKLLKAAKEDSATSLGGFFASPKTASRGENPVSDLIAVIGGLEIDTDFFPDLQDDFNKSRDVTEEHKRLYDEILIKHNPNPEYRESEDPSRGMGGFKGVLTKFAQQKLKKILLNSGLNFESTEGLNTLFNNAVTKFRDRAKDVFDQAKGKVDEIANQRAAEEAARLREQERRLAKAEEEALRLKEQQEEAERQARVAKIQEINTAITGATVPNGTDLTTDKPCNKTSMTGILRGIKYQDNSSIFATIGQGNDLLKGGTNINLSESAHDVLMKMTPDNLDIVLGRVNRGIDAARGKLSADLRAEELRRQEDEDLKAKEKAEADAALRLAAEAEENAAKEEQLQTFVTLFDQVLGLRRTEELSHGVPAEEITTELRKRDGTFAKLIGGDGEGGYKVQLLDLVRTPGSTLASGDGAIRDEIFSSNNSGQLLAANEALTASLQALKVKVTQNEAGRQAEELRLKEQADAEEAARRLKEQEEADRQAREAEEDAAKEELQTFVTLFDQVLGLRQTEELSHGVTAKEITTELQKENGTFAELIGGDGEGGYKAQLLRFVNAPGSTLVYDPGSDIQTAILSSNNSEQLAVANEALRQSLQALEAQVTQNEAAARRKAEEELLLKEQADAALRRAQEALITDFDAYVANNLNVKLGANGKQVPNTDGIYNLAEILGKLRSVFPEDVEFESLVIVTKKHTKSIGIPQSVINHIRTLKMPAIENLGGKLGELNLQAAADRERLAKQKAEEELRLKEQADADALRLAKQKAEEDARQAEERLAREKAEKAKAEERRRQEADRLAQERRVRLLEAVTGFVRDNTSVNDDGVSPERPYSRAAMADLLRRNALLPAASLDGDHLPAEDGSAIDLSNLPQAVRAHVDRDDGLDNSAIQNALGIMQKDAEERRAVEARRLAEELLRRQQEDADLKAKQKAEEDARRAAEEAARRRSQINPDTTLPNADGSRYLSSSSPLGNLIEDIAKIMFKKTREDMISPGNPVYNDDNRVNFLRGTNDEMYDGQRRTIVKNLLALANASDAQYNVLMGNPSYRKTVEIFDQIQEGKGCKTFDEFIEGDSKSKLVNDLTVEMDKLNSNLADIVREKLDSGSLPKSFDLSSYATRMSTAGDLTKGQLSGAENQHYIPESKVKYPTMDQEYFKRLQEAVGSKSR